MEICTVNNKKILFDRNWLKAIIAPTQQERV
jgi:hypothetical protein